MEQKDNIAYWHPSFQDEFENMTIDEGVLIWYFSGAVFVVRTPHATIYLDPYFGGDPADAAEYAYRVTQIPLDPARVRTADAVFISHDHYDHCHEQTLEPMARGTDAMFYGPASAVKVMSTCDLPKERIRQVQAGDRIEVKDAVVTVWPAYDEYEPQAVTYTIESGGVKVFFGGDTSAGPVFDEIGAKGDLDIAMAAFGRKWYMDEAQLLDAAERLHPKLLLPFHWELWRAYTGDPLTLGRLVERRNPSFEVKLLQTGDYLHYLPGGRFIKGR